MYEEEKKKYEVAKELKIKDEKAQQLSMQKRQDHVIHRSYID